MTVDPLVFFWMREAYKAAAEKSTDPRTQNGAVLISSDGGILLRSANHFPTGVDETPERWISPTVDKPDGLKYKFVEHAERNLIFAAAKKGIPTDGLTVVCPYFACADCARAFIQAGIRRVIGHDAPFHKTHPGWGKSIEVGDTMFREAGVAFERLQFPSFDGLAIMFDGKYTEL